ncbi:hypothetical protein ACCE15_19210 [Pseudomonas parafulva]|uniref:hypothetical protein n=1 Tax=Pseudomonas parafulva TaxID=157782 RepID=UPI0035682506
MNATATPAVDFKKKYDETTEAGSATLHVPAAKNLASKVIDTFYEVLTPTAELNLQNEIKKAAEKNDFDKLEELMAQRKEIKANQSKDANIIKEIRKHDFPQVLKAFRKEFDSIVYEIAYNVLTGSHTAITEAGKSGKGGRGKSTTTAPTGENTRTQAVYNITKDDKTVEFVIRAGRSKLSQDRDALAFLGFTIVTDEDGKEALEPGTIEVSEGKHEPATRKAIVEAILAGNVEMFKGYTAIKAQ